MQNVALRKSELRSKLPFAVLALAAILFRLPALANASEVVSSDSSVVGLQAMHVLRGEVALHLWGADYQSSAETILLAPLLAVFGAHPIVLVVFSITSHLVVMWTIYAVLQRAVASRLAFLLTLAVTWTTWSALVPTIMAPRGWAISVYFAGIYWLDGASRSRRPLLGYAVGAALPVVATHLDLFVLQMLPAAIVFALLTTRDDRRGVTGLERILVVTISSGVALLVLAWLRSKATGEPASLTSVDAANVPKNFTHLWHEALPATLGLKVYALDEGRTVLWMSPPWLEVLQKLGAFVFVGGYASAALLFAAPKIPWRARRLGIFALLGAGASVAGFLASGYVFDAAAMRYLAPISLLVPFAFAPLVSRMPWQASSATLAPYLASTLIAGWMTYGYYVRGPLLVRTARGAAEEEQRLGEMLRRRGIRYAMADYWLSYRLTFLWRRNPIVVPFPGDGIVTDRYAPYRNGFEASSHVAYVFHPSCPRENASTYEEKFKAASVPFTEETVEGFTVLVFDQTPKN